MFAPPRPSPPPYSVRAGAGGEAVSAGCAWGGGQALPSGMRRLLHAGLSLTPGVEGTLPHRVDGVGHM